MTKLFGEDINSFRDRALINGMASIFDITGKRSSQKMKEYFAQDPEVINAQAILSDIETISIYKRILDN